MTTPDKEEMPTEDRTAGDFWAEKRDGRWQLQMRHRGPGSSFCVAQINHWADNPEALTTRIADACNAYEPMREALAFYAAPENHGLQQHGLCFSSAVDIDEGERARAALSTLPVNDRQTSDDAGRLREALERLTFEVGCLRDGCGGDALKASWQEARAALKGVPQPASHWTPEMKRAAMTDARNVCELADALREIEKQCIQADDPEHHTLSLVKHLARHALARLPQPASEAGKLSTDTGEEA